MKQSTSNLLYCAFLNALLVSAAQEEQGKHRLLGLIPNAWLPANFEYIPWVPFYPVYRPFLDAVLLMHERVTDFFYNVKREPFDGECGTQARSHKQNLFLRKRITGGTDAEPHSWPWQALIEYKVSGKVKFTCGGALFRVEEGDTKTDILATAAQCVTDNVNGKPELWDHTGFRITLGAHKRKAVYEYGRRIRKAEKLLRHENYDPTTSLNDIALIKLATPIEFGESIRPICLPESELVSAQTVGAKHPDAILNEETWCGFTGWGRISQLAPGLVSSLLGYLPGSSFLPGGLVGSSLAKHLKQLKMTVHKPDKCRGNKLANVFGSAFSGWGDKYFDNEMICASTSSLGHENTCHGDTGGPLACLVNHKWTMYGILSFGRTGKTCLGLGKPEIFTRVSNYTTWIRDNAIMLSTWRDAAGYSVEGKNDEEQSEEEKDERKR